MLTGCRTCLLVALVLVSVARIARASTIFEDIGTFTSATILEADPSVRSQGMGDAGTAAFWDGTNAWANPALLGYARGVIYERSASDDDLLDFDTARTSIGYEGIGISTTGRPIPGLGKIDARLGVEISSGGSTTTFAFDDRVKSFSLGVSMSEVLAGIARAGGSVPAFTRWFDVGVGFSEKRVEKETTTRDSFGSSHQRAHTFARDRGVVLRARAPFEAVSLDLAYGYADINYNKPILDRFPTARDRRNGLSARAAWDGVPARRRLPSWFAEGIAPLVSASWAMDFVHTTEFGDHHFTVWGAEAALGNVLFGRVGQRSGGHSWGVGVGLPLGRYGGARWDHSNTTRAELSDLKRNAWTVWLDPLAIYRATR